MCGRYSKGKVKKQVEEHFEAIETVEEEVAPSFNIAPTQPAAVITLQQHDKIQRFKWGLISSRTPSYEAGTPIINARIETLAEKPSFASLIEQRRCIVLTDGYYEWKRTGKTIVPYRISLSDDGLFAYAGLWDERIDKTGQPVRTFTIITMPAHPTLAHIHERMPAILMPGKEKLWLKGTRPGQDLLEVFRQQAGEVMKAYTVGDEVNKATIDAPTLWQPRSYNEPKIQGDLFG